jgi:hypothetical protein
MAILLLAGRARRNGGRAAVNTPMWGGASSCSTPRHDGYSADLERGGKRRYASPAKTSR